MQVDKSAETEEQKAKRHEAYSLPFVSLVSLAVLI